MKYYVIDAFTDSLFSGNPAGVCLPEAWPDAELMQRIARENALPETAFAVKEPGGWRIRWFTPAFEMDLCGHATLATGFTVLNFVEPGAEEVTFQSQSGEISVRRRRDLYSLDFPSRPPVPVETHELVERSLGARVLGCFQSRDLIALLESADAVAGLKPDFELMRGIPGLVGLVPTAPGDDCDFVSRYFDPNDAIIEDPVTGSAHCTLIPFWSARLQKTELVARQLSARGGTLFCRDAGERVEISGRAALYLDGEIKV